MPKPTMLSEPTREIEQDSVQAEERFLFDTQMGMQKILNQKGFKYKDLALGMGVSEARVSQLFGDDNNNLTIRTIARVFHQLGETPVLLSESELQKKLDDASGIARPRGGWVVAAEAQYFDIIPGSELAPSIDEPASRDRRPTDQEWVAAEGQLSARTNAA